MADTKHLFRRCALEHAGGTEALDVLPLLPRPADHIGLVMLLALLAAAGTWAFNRQHHPHGNR